ncbi:MAG: hypothetical protein II499_02695 [Firmicutes bacterium]|nr:hypothetical protein [Bacillota bacterium]
MNKEAIIRKLTSRKLWMAIALFVSGVLTAAGKETVAETVSGLIIQAAAVIGYIVGEGLVDASNKDAIYLDGVTLDGVADVEEGSENG